MARVRAVGVGPVEVDTLAVTRLPVTELALRRPGEPPTTEPFTAV